jgi:hypothetical protein
MKAGPKAAVDARVLPFRRRLTGSARFAAFCQRFIRVPKGTGALSPLGLQPWQIELVGSVLDADPKSVEANRVTPTVIALLDFYQQVVPPFVTELRMSALSEVVLDQA